MKLTEYFSNTWLMCFDARSSLWQQCDEELTQLGIHTQRYVMGKGKNSALQYDFIDYHEGKLPERQRLNYASAVINLMRNELNKGKQYITFLEDDIRARPESKTILDSVVRQYDEIGQPPVDIFYLNTIRKLSQYEEVSPNILRLDCALGLRAVILSRQVMGIIAELKPRPDSGIDGQLMEHHTKLKIFSAFPDVFTADRDLFSYQHGNSSLQEWHLEDLEIKGRAKL